MVYKDLQKKTFPPLRPKIYNPPPNLKQTSHTQLGVTYAQIAEALLKQPSQHQQPYQCNNSAIQELKDMMKGLFEQLGTMFTPLTTVLGKLK
jgi:hypothetical protein